MKKAFKFVSLAVITLVFASCEIDNYDGPNASMEGRILDHQGIQLQTEHGSGGMVLRMEEVSWTESESITPRDLNVKMDGTYRNTKLFAAEYVMYPFNGAFYPLTDEEKTHFTLGKGNTVMDFTVTPYLKVEWVQKPTLIAGNKISCSAKFTRIMKDGATAPAVKEGRLFISTTHFVAANNMDAEYFPTARVTTNAEEGTEITFVSAIGARFSPMTLYVRVGFRCADTDQKHNYCEPVELKIP